MTQRDPHPTFARLPASPAGNALGALGQWLDGTQLPRPVVAGLLERLQRRLASGSPPIDGHHWPAGWPAPAQALPALQALAQLEGEAVSTLLAHGALDPAILSAVQAEFAMARSRVGRRATAAEGTPQTLQEALEARDRQLSIATHELRTPISSILLNLQLLERTARERGALDAQTIARLLAVPSRQLQRLTRMVDLLLDAAQVENERLVLAPEPLDLCELVHEAAGRLAELARSAGCTVSLDGCEPVPGHWDRLRLDQVVTNLLTNAIKYGGGRVDVRTRRRQDAACIEVGDHGGGIPPEDQQRIFRPFERLASARSEDGAGLGLYIVREIVRAHGGHIELASTPRQGSTFIVSLPI